MEDFFSLKILDLFRPLFEAFGVEYEKMRLIVNMKLTLDKRKNNSSENKNSLMQSVILYLIIGFVALLYPASSFISIHPTVHCSIAVLP